jgi:hypothetical protein
MALEKVTQGRLFQDPSFEPAGIMRMMSGRCLAISIEPSTAFWLVVRICKRSIPWHTELDFGVKKYPGGKFANGTGRNNAFWLVLEFLRGQGANVHGTAFGV